MTPDGLPIIGAEPRLQGLWYATGHGRNGILLAGITGVIIRHLLSGEQPSRRSMPSPRALLVLVSRDAAVADYRGRGQ